MGTQEYYELWLKTKEFIRKNLETDQQLQDFALSKIGLKPQAHCVETIGRVYNRYCDIFNKLCDIYDQGIQPQRRADLKNLIDAVTCRLIEVKDILEEGEFFQHTYTENALQTEFMVPEDISIKTPYFLAHEIRNDDMQYIANEILAGKRLGDPTPTPSEIERKEEERLLEEKRIRDEKEAERLKLIALGEEVEESESSAVLSPEEMEALRLLNEYNSNVANIQRMERSRRVIRELAHKSNKDFMLNLELANIKAPPPKPEIRDRAVKLIQNIYRKFIKAKRDKVIENKLKFKLGMAIPSWSPPSAKIQLENAKVARRKLRQNYYEKWIKDMIKEQTHSKKYRTEEIMENIAAEIRGWWQDWYKKVKVFDEFPWPGEGGSILYTRGETFTPMEYWEWRQQAEKKQPEKPKPTKEQQKSLENAIKERARKDLEKYKKSRLSPDTDPGFLIPVGTSFDFVKQAWFLFETTWRTLDMKEPMLNVVRGHINDIITEKAYCELQLELRPIVDDMMRLELVILQNALKLDYEGNRKPVPLTFIREKPKPPKIPKKDKSKPAALFQKLVDAGIIVKYPQVTLDDFFGDRDYAAAELRAIPWYPVFSAPATMGDVREMVRLRCIVALSANCPNVDKSVLIVGPASSGKRMLVNAIATETNAILIDLSFMNLYNKGFEDPKEFKDLFTYVNKIARFMQPTIIMMNNADKTFYKKVPPEEKPFDPTRLSKDFFKLIVKGIKPEEKILVLGLATEPWLAKSSGLQKAFPGFLLLPRTDYGTVTQVLFTFLMKYHGVDRNFNYHSVAQALRGYDINAIKKGIKKLMNGLRTAQLAYKPLEPVEVLNAVMSIEEANYVTDDDYQMYKDWYRTYSKWGSKLEELKEMVACQLEVKLKNDAKKKK